jgi:hypothetical protein
MTTLTTRPLRLLVVEFNELYARHLCRHSQSGVNVVHLIALFATWYAIYGLLYWLADVEWVLAVPAFVYLAVIAPNLPLRVFVATALFLALIVAAVCLLPAPWWAYLIVIPVAYELQALSHKVYTVETDMTEFNKKYAKGSVLFVVLLIYEVPIVLNFLLFASRRAELRQEPVEPPALQPAAHAARLADDQDRAAAKAS